MLASILMITLCGCHPQLPQSLPDSNVRLQRHRPMIHGILRTIQELVQQGLLLVGPVLVELAELVAPVVLGGLAALVALEPLGELVELAEQVLGLVALAAALQQAPLGAVLAQAPQTLQMLQTAHRQQAVFRLSAPRIAASMEL